MEVIEKSIEADVPVETAYNQWTQFEEFPKFMEGDLKRFVEFVEKRGRESGAWRGQI